jgi:hypothetical protein
MDLIYEIAKSIVKRREAKRKDKSDMERKIAAEESVARQSKITFIRDVFIKKYIQEATEVFKSMSVPRFSVGEKVLTNWFSHGDGWEGYVSSLQNHTPFRGPLVVKIEEIVLDSLYLEEFLGNLLEGGKFSDIMLIEDHYLHFCEIVSKEIKARDTKLLSYTNLPKQIPDIGWTYKIKVPKDETEYWRYCWSERKLLKLDSAAALLSQKAWKKEQKAEKNRIKASEAKEELNGILTELAKQNVGC